MYHGLVALAKFVGNKRKLRQKLTNGDQQRAVVLCTDVVSMLRQNVLSNKFTTAVFCSSYKLFIKTAQNRGLLSLSEFLFRFKSSASQPCVQRLARFKAMTRGISQWEARVHSRCYRKSQWERSQEFENTIKMKIYLRRWIIGPRSRNGIPRILCSDGFPINSANSTPVHIRIDPPVQSTAQPLLTPMHPVTSRIWPDSGFDSSFNLSRKVPWYQTTADQRRDSNRTTVQGVLHTIVSKWITRWAEATVLSVLVDRSLSDSESYYKLYKIRTAWSVLHRALSFSQRLRIKHDFTAEKGYKRVLFMRFVHKVRFSQACFTRGDRRCKRAAKYYRRRCVLLCLQQWVQRKHRSDRAILATAALSRTSVHLLREAEKVRQRERALAVKFRCIGIIRLFAYVVILILPTTVL